MIEIDRRIFQTLNSVISNSLSLKYQRFTPSDCKNIGIRRFKFGGKNSFINWMDISIRFEGFESCELKKQVSALKRDFKYKGSAFFCLGKEVRVEYHHTGCPTKHYSSKTIWKSSLIFDFLRHSVVNLFSHVSFLKTIT